MHGRFSPILTGKAVGSGDRFVAINKTGKIVVRYDENENPICFDDEIGLD